MNGLAMTRTIACGVLVALASAGCTQMTAPPEEDAGAQQDAAPTDAGPEPDSGVLPPPVLETCVEAGSTLGQACSGGGCDDGCYCNGVERCEAGVCVAGEDPCPDEVDCTADVCLEEANRCFHEPQHEMCTNGNACDGVELCSLTTGCGPGAPPYCNDESSCTIDSCDPAMGCVFSARDLDGDGYTDGGCGGEDCDDDPRFGTMIHPGATEICMNRRDDDCDGMRDFNDSDCTPTNDTCETAVVLPGPGTYSGATRSLAANYSLGCRSGGPDAVFRFTLAEMSDVTVTVAGGGSGVGVALRSWAQCGSGPDDKCSTGSPPTFLRRSLPAGEYAIIVQSNSGGGAFDLNLRIGPPTDIPPIDVCGPGTQDLCGGVACTTLTGAVFTGMFADVEDDYELSCGSSSRRDAVYRFTLDSPKDVTVRASSGSFSWTTTYVALSTDCDRESAERRCVASGPAELRQRELPAGTYYLIVESDEADAATYSLNVTITDPVPRGRGDACSSAIDISEATLGGGGAGSVSAGTLELDSGTSCGGANTWFRDATFMFTLPETRDVTLTTTIGVTWSTYYVSLQSACGDGSSDLRCWSGSDRLGQSWRSLPAGTYFVTVSTENSSGSVSANLVTRPPTPIPPNDRCAGAVTLTSGVRQSGSTIGFEDDAAGGSCASGSLSDAFYVFTLPSRADVNIIVRDADVPATTTFWLTLRGETCGTGREQACVSSSGTPPAAGISATLDAGTYYLQVESNSTDGSDFNIFPTFFPTL